MPNFEKALEIGKRIEEIVLNRVRESDPFAIIIKGKFKQFDIYSPSTNTRIEVKSDIQSQHTHNFLVEVYMYGKPSALLSTEADSPQSLAGATVYPPKNLPRRWLRQFLITLI